MKTIQKNTDDLLVVNNDNAQSAKAIKPQYVSDKSPGITRLKKRKRFNYLQNGKVIKDRDILQRIRQLVIPPAWTNVWICPSENGHIQATGIDLRKRKQYLYHKRWAAHRNNTKFYQLYEFGKRLPMLRARLKKDLSAKEFSDKKVLAIMISLMEQTYIRVGNKSYEKLYGSFGLTTLKDKNVTVNGSHLELAFTGKKGIEHRISLKNKKLAKAVKQCRDIPGKELFQYFDPTGQKKCIDSGMLNSYLKECTGGEFTAKDFRTWAGSLQALKSFKMVQPPMDENACKKNIITVVDEVSKKLGNSRSICRKYYIHPALLTLYEGSKLSNYFENITKSKMAKYLEEEETILLKLLQRQAMQNKGK